MVFDKLKNYKLYGNLSAPIAKALALAAETDFAEIADGKYPLDSDRLYYMVQRYKTAPLLDKIEAHRKYIDIQLLAKGTERIGYIDSKGLKQAVEYSDEKDVEFFLVPKDITFLNMSQGAFAIFWPHDAHMPGRQIDKTQDVLKIVFKIRI
jgi:YhcH/YjgK/YiaL family protein